MDKQLVAKASMTINARIARVWEALTNPETIKQYIFGTNVISDWKGGSSIVWKGEWQGRAYEDKGVILKIEQAREHSEKNWGMMMASLKKLLESSP